MKKRTIATQVKRIRLKLNLSQLQLAKKLRLKSRATVMRWESGEMMPGSLAYLRLLELESNHGKKKAGAQIASKARLELERAHRQSGYTRFPSLRWNTKIPCVDCGEPARAGASL